MDLRTATAWQFYGHETDPSLEGHILILVTIYHPVALTNINICLGTGLLWGSRKDGILCEKNYSCIDCNQHLLSESLIALNKH